jgi:hypothetical protein
MNMLTCPLGFLVLVTLAAAQFEQTPLQLEIQNNVPGTRTEPCILFKI